MTADRRTLIRGARVFDGTGSAPRRADIAIEGERIMDVASTITPRAGDGTIDASGLVAIPGLIDAHVHISREPEHDGPLYLSAGVTTARDTGGPLEGLVALRERWRSGDWSGPRLVICGPLVDGDPPVWPRSMTLVVTSADEARAAVDRVSAGGVDAVKAYSGIRAELLRAVIERATEHNLPVLGDLSATKASEAIDLGIRGLEHASIAYDDIVAPDLRVTMRLFHEKGAATWRQAWNRGLAAADPDGPAARALAARIAERGVWFDPTLVVVERLSRLDDPEITDAPEVALATEANRASWRERAAGRAAVWSAEDYATARAAAEICVRFTGTVLRAGGTVLVGSDAPNPFVVPGWSLHRELELLVLAGMTPSEAITHATSGNAAALGLADEVGTIAPGRSADLVFLAGDPTTDIRSTRRVRLVVQRGLTKWRDGAVVSA